jgi:transcription termination/antitermination protein NusG
MEPDQECPVWDSKAAAMLEPRPSNASPSNASIDKRWFALTVKPRRETLAVQGLSAKGIENFLPSYVVRRRWSDRTKTVSEPIFPGYIFCRTSLASPVLPVPGVQGFVSFAGRPEPIPDQEIDGIMRMMASGLPLEPMAYLRAGDCVRVTHGPLAGVKGTLWEGEGQRRLVVGIEMLGRSVAVNVDRTVLEPVGLAALRNAFDT